MMQYNKIAKFLHWSMAILILSLLILGFSLESLENKEFFFKLHKSLGLLALFFVIFRLFWRFKTSYPALPKGTPNLLIFLAKITVVSLYLLMFLMPITGLLTSNAFGRPASFFGLFNLTFLGKNLELGSNLANLHSLGAISLIILILFHLIGGLFHHFILKDNLLKRLF